MKSTIARSARVFCLSATGASLFAAHAASANGRFPLAGQIVVDPSDPAHVVARATYGLLVSGDGGRRWSWVCEGALGFDTEEDPTLGILHDGTIVAGLTEGLAESRDRACSWALAALPGEARSILDLAVDPGDATRAIALASTGPDGGGSTVVIDVTAPAPTPTATPTPSATPTPLPSASAGPPTATPTP